MNKISANVKLNCFVNGPITSDLISLLISEHQSNFNLGAHSLFLGQVREDEIKIDGSENGIRKVKSIIYSAYELMAEKEIQRIKEDTIIKFKLNSLNIYHSIGEVKTGEISLLVMASSPHRANCLNSLEYVVIEIKNKVPVWKKEMYSDGSHRWIE